MERSMRNQVRRHAPGAFLAKALEGRNHGGATQESRGRQNAPIGKGGAAQAKTVDRLEDGGQSGNGLIVQVLEKRSGQRFRVGKGELLAKQAQSVGIGAHCAVGGHIARDARCPTRRGLVLGWLQATRILSRRQPSSRLGKATPSRAARPGPVGGQGHTRRALRTEFAGSLSIRFAGRVGGAGSEPALAFLRVAEGRQGEQKWLVCQFLDRFIFFQQKRPKVPDVVSEAGCHLPPRRLRSLPSRL